MFGWLDGGQDGRASKDTTITETGQCHFETRVLAHLPFVSEAPAPLDTCCAVCMLAKVLVSATEGFLLPYWPALVLFQVEDAGAHIVLSVVQAAERAR
jgi:hypothetical protein